MLELSGLTTLGAMLRIRRALLFALSHRTLALIRWDLHFLRVRARNTLVGANKRLRTRTFCAPRPRYLNLGSGERGFAAPNWINVDGYPFPHVHHLMDLARPLPFDDASFDGILFQHVLEHFPQTVGLAILAECRRILVPGGVLRVAVPDAERVIRSYAVNPEELMTHRHAPMGLPIESVNLYAYQRYEHQCLYDYALLRRSLQDAGFAEISRCEIHEGAIAMLAAADDEAYRWESLYVEARRT